MYHFNAEKQYGISQTNLIVSCVLLLTGIGLITLYSASYEFARRFFRNGTYFIARQAVFSAVGIVLFFICLYINLEKLRVFIFPLLAVSAVLCVLTMIPGIGIERLGASRWIKIGSFTYQPSEIVKIVLPLYLAHILDKKADYIDIFSSGILPPVIVTGIFLGLIYAQNNFSTAILIMFNAMVIFFFAGLSYRYFLAVFFIFFPVSTLLVFTKTHRIIRLVSFLKPQWDPLGAGYQVNASRESIISGGFLGKGIGHGTRKIASVPEIHSDFIFSAYIEESGFLGMLLLFALFTFFVILGYKSALQSKTIFSRLLASGLTTMIVSQVLLNIAVVSGALPATGIPLPFFSAGGSSLVTTLIAAGFIANVSREQAAGLPEDNNGR
jgi:cell division protein FtsW